jgi:hypothetical protein
MKKRCVLGMLAVALVFGLAGCGTILKAKNLSVTSESGKPDDIQIETKNASGNVVEIYAGTLPAQIKMPKAPKGSELIIHYRQRRKAGNSNIETEF